MTQQGSNAFQPQSTFGSEYNALRFIMQSSMSKMRTATLCKVIAVTNSGGVSPVGFVDLQPLVNQVTGSGIASSQGTIHGIPYFRIQGGLNAIILDPQIGDIGMAVFAESDISSVVKNKAQSNPGSARQFDVADGIYLGGFLNAAPTQYIQFLNGGAGINILSPAEITLTAPTVTVNASSGMTINANVTVNGMLSATGDVIATSGGSQVSLTNHLHGGVAAGTSNTMPPVPGT